MSAVAVASAVGAESMVLEPHRIRTSTVRFSNTPRTRFVFWSDFHYRGDEAYASHLVDTINQLQPEFVCFVGDLVDDRNFQEPALEFIKRINVPVFGVPGNHDYHSRSSFSLNRKAFESTGGGWLINKIATVGAAGVQLCGSAERYVGFVPALHSAKRILLSHYPITANETAEKNFDAILAGHSHGGQVRVPFYGAVYLPRFVGRYEWGRYTTPGGPLYVTAGIGTYKVPARFNCPPEVVVAEI